MKKQALLIELGTEELPPKALKKLSAAFTKELLQGLLESEFIQAEHVSNATSFASPRRLGLLLDEVLDSQPDQVINRRGPAIQAAFKEDGQPSPAAQGFAKSCGVEVADLDRLKTDKGEWLSYNLEQTGQSITELLPSIIDNAIKRLPIAKRMRWGEGSAEFVRPVHWLVVLHGADIIPATVLGIKSGNISRGHRFHSNGELSIAHAQDYEALLKDQGHVMASFDKRQALIQQQIQEAANSVNGHIQTDQALLDEVTGLVELPTAMLGEFDKAFLEVPQECLISSMRDHQKYFHIVDAAGKLMPYFITVSNIQSTDPKRVIEGNQRVLLARLSDARFFWQTDQKNSLESCLDKLSHVLFHAKLGSVLDKTHRVQNLAGLIAEKIKADPVISKRGALLAKADLVSDMVGEFDELQGIMGHYYADLDGENKLVGDCIEQHYWPKFAGDALPTSNEAQSVALAEKIDSLVGIYAAGEIPTGDKDPYALRRSALGILRILIEQKQTLKLSELIAMSASVYADKQKIEIEPAVQQQIVDFTRGRLTAYFQSQDIATTMINSVMACRPDSPLDFEQRLKAVSAFASAPEASDLSAANKRIANILKKQKTAVTDTVNQDDLSQDEEIALYNAIQTIEHDCKALFNQGDYNQGLQKLAALHTPVDNFFEHVMVMSDDPKQQRNRLALLMRLQNLFLQVADISLLQA